jgi:hypothetical protein
MYTATLDPGAVQLQVTGIHANVSKRTRRVCARVERRMSTWPIAHCIWLAWLRECMQSSTSRICEIEKSYFT